MRNQPIPTLEQREEHFVFIEFEEFKEFVENVGIAQEIGAVIGTIQ